MRDSQSGTIGGLLQKQCIQEGPYYHLERGVEFCINRLCVVGSIIASWKWGACRLCI